MILGNWMDMSELAQSRLMEGAPALESLELDIRGSCLIPDYLFQGHAPLLHRLTVSMRINAIQPQIGRAQIPLWMLRGLRDLTLGFRCSVRELIDLLRHTPLLESLWIEECDEQPWLIQATLQAAAESPPTTLSRLEYLTFKTNQAYPFIALWKSIDVPSSTRLRLEFNGHGSTDDGDWDAWRAVFEAISPYISFASQQCPSPPAIDVYATPYLGSFKVWIKDSGSSFSTSCPQCDAEHKESTHFALSFSWDIRRLSERDPHVHVQLLGLFSVLFTPTTIKVLDVFSTDKGDPWLVKILEYWTLVLRGVPAVETLRLLHAGASREVLQVLCAEPVAYISSSSTHEVLLPNLRSLVFGDGISLCYESDKPHRSLPWMKKPKPVAKKAGHDEQDGGDTIDVVLVLLQQRAATSTRLEVFITEDCEVNALGLKAMQQYADVKVKESTTE